MNPSAGQSLSTATQSIPQTSMPEVGDAIYMAVYPYGGTHVVDPEHLEHMSDGATIIVMEVKELKKVSVKIELN